MRRLVALVIIAVALAWTAPAHAATWTAPGDTGLAGTLVPGSGAWLELPWEVLWSQPFFDVRSVQQLPSGDVLVASGTGVVKVLSRDGDVVWQYARAGLTPWHAEMTPAGTVLIASRREDMVVEIDYSTKETLWRYGGPDVIRDEEATQTPLPGWLHDPFMATRLANGDTIICDNQGGRAIEVRSSDYDPTKTNDGYDATSIVWEYVDPANDWPRFAQRLNNGITLIATSTSVLEVDSSGGRVWQVPDGVLGQPSSAWRLDDGTTLIAEESSVASALGRVLRVDRSGTVLWQYGVTSLPEIDDIGLDSPRCVVPGIDGSVLVADQRHARVVELGHALSGAAESAPIDCGLPGARKQFMSVTAQLDVPADTSATIEYSIDSGPWQALSGSTLPSGTYGTLIRYRVTMSTTRRDATPRLLGVTIGYEPAPESVASDGTGAGSGTGGSRGSRAPTGQTTGGTMSGGSGYAAGGTLSDPGVLAGPSSVHRGWAMARISTPAVSGGLSGDGGSPAPELGGLLALGTVYAAGILSVPLQRIFGLLLGRLRTAS